MINAFVISSEDDVATVSESVTRGQPITYMLGGQEITIQAIDDIPKYHKVAVRIVGHGADVRKYGEVIGYATSDILIGNHVHTHNLSDMAHK